MLFFKTKETRLWKLMLGGLLAALMGFTVPVLALDRDNADPAAPQQISQNDDITNPSSVVPGTLNYIQGSVFIQGQALTAQSAKAAILKTGEVLTTGQGKVEMLLTPGVYFRLGDNSAVKMVSPDLAWTAVDLEKGKAIVEVDQIRPENNIQIYHGGIGTELLKTGIYQFDAATSTVSVFKGEAAVHQPDDQWVVVKAGRQFALNQEPGVKPQKFDEAAAEGDLYAWSSLRSHYLGQADQELARNYGDFYPGWGFSPGWYPYGWGYTYFGGPMWQPFGWGPYGWPYGGPSVFIPYYGNGHPHYHWHGR